MNGHLALPVSAPRLVVSIHDVAPSTLQASSRAIRRMEQFGVTCSLLVVPGLWQGMSLSDSPRFIDWLHEVQTRGHEVVQHGYTHDKVTAPSWARLTSAVMTRGCNEFHTASKTEALRRMRLGADALEQYGFAPIGFVPPGWLASDGTIKAAQEMGFSYLTTRTRLINLQKNTVIEIPAWSHRPNSTLTFLGVAWWKLGTLTRSLIHHDLRLALHPGDITDKKLMAVSEDCIRRLLDVGYVSKSYSDLIQPELRLVC